LPEITIPDGTIVDAGIENILILFQAPYQYRKCSFATGVLRSIRAEMSWDVFPGIPFILPDHLAIGWK